MCLTAQIPICKAHTMRVTRLQDGLHPPDLSPGGENLPVEQSPASAVFPRDTAVPCSSICAKPFRDSVMDSCHAVKRHHHRELERAARSHKRWALYANR